MPTNKIYGMIPLSIVLNLSLLSAQQLPNWTLISSFQSINPAHVEAGFLLEEKKRAVIGVTYRQSSSSAFPNPPKTAILRGACLIPTKSQTAHLLVGGSIVQDKAGAFSETAEQGRLSVVFFDNFDPTDWGISVGLNGGLGQFRFDNKIVTYIQPEIGSFQQDYYDKSNAQLGAGIFVYRRLPNARKWLIYGGASAQQLFKNDLNFKGNNSNMFAFPRVSHFYGVLGSYYLPNSNYENLTFLESSIKFNYVPRLGLILDMNVLYQSRKVVRCGLGYLTSGTVHGTIGFMLPKNLQMNMSYAYPLSIQAVSFASTYELDMVLSF